jgi:predicted metal-dependent phosphoesterase TrpH
MGIKNILKVAKEKELSVIAITDHNSSLNSEAFIKVFSKENIIVIPGLEITCKEEFHIVTLFKNFKIAKELSKILYDSLLPININEEKHGYQLILDENENIIEKEERILNQATISVDEIIDFVNKNDGIIIFAHIDKPYNSLIANLGFIPKKYEQFIFEITKENLYKNLKVVKNSDAHNLIDIGQRYFYIESEKNIDRIFEALKKGDFYYDV